MKKIIVSILAIGLLLGTTPLTMGEKEQSILPLNENTLYVGGSGPGNYSSIQDAINASSNGDTIFVFNGTYYENLEINKSITLKGEDTDSTIIDGVDSYNIINISANSVKITGFTIQNDSGDFDLYNLSVGITIGLNCHDVIITGNTITDTSLAVFLDRSHDNIISKNNIHNNTVAGIMLNFSDNNDITENIIVDNYAVGIMVGDSGHNTIANNTILNHEQIGLWLGGYWTCNNVVCGNTIAGHGYGIWLMHLAHHNIISGNSITNNGDGINMFLSAHFNVICENTIADNTNYSIYITPDGCTYHENFIYHNNFINNGKPPFDNCFESITYWNDSYPSGGNYWDDYAGVDNYHGPNQDIPGSDGIGDTPYNISWKKDYYPLMSSYGWINEPPNTPTIDGPISGKPGVEYEYTFVSTDLDGDDIYYYIDWEDNTYEEWIGPYGSSKEITVTHTWSEQGTYEIRAKAKDICGAESDWGYLEVTMPYNGNQNSQSQQSGLQGTVLGVVAQPIAKNLFFLFLK